MIELSERIRTVDLPYTLRLHGVSEEMFDELIDEDTKAELIDGVMIVHSPASPRHNAMAGFIRHVLTDYVQHKDIGEVFGPDDLVHLATCWRFAPDGFFLFKDKVPSPLPEKQFGVTPEIAIEVLSPSNRDEDLNDKRPAYREAGVGEIWLIDPDIEEIAVDRRQKKRYATTTVANGKIKSSVIPGFWIEAEWLWAEPLPKVMPCVQQLLK